MRDAKGHQSCGEFVKTVPVYCTCRPKCKDGYLMTDEIVQRCDETRHWSPLLSMPFCKKLDVAKFVDALKGKRYKQYIYNTKHIVCQFEDL